MAQNNQRYSDISCSPTYSITAAIFFFFSEVSKVREREKEKKMT